MSSSFRVGLTLAAFVALACAAPGSRPPGQSPAPQPATAEDASRRPSRRANVITQEEIDRSSYRDAFELVRTIRPGWLQHRGEQSIALPDDVDVYMDGVRLAGLATLREIPLTQISRLEYLNSSEATFRFGTQKGVGAILVTSRTGR